MSKHNQSPTLGKLSDFSDSPSPPPDGDLEVRVTNLERAVNEILLQLLDISEQLDQPRRDKGFRPSPQEPAKQQKKPKPAPSTMPDLEPMSSEEVVALADGIYELLTDGCPRSKSHIMGSLGCRKEAYTQAREHLIDTGRMQVGDGNELVAGKICNVSAGLAIWTQEQIDAELQRRKSAASDDNTQGDTNA